MQAIKKTEEQVEQTEISPPPLRRRKPKRSPIKARENSSRIVIPLNAQDLLKNELKTPPPSPVNPDGLCRAQAERVVSYVHPEQFEDFAGESSVVLKAKNFTRSPIHKFYDHSKRVMDRGYKNVARRYPELLSKGKQIIHQLRKKYSTLSSTQQQFVALAPYLLAAFVIAFAFTLYGDSNKELSKPAELEPLRLDNVILSAEIPVEAESKSETNTIPNVEVGNEVSEASRIIKVQKEVPYQQFTNRRTWLRSKTKMESRRLVRLKTNTSLTIHPGFPTPQGWVLAQNRAGEVGFIRLRYLSDTKKKFPTRSKR